MSSSDYVISTHYQDGLKFEMYTGAVEVGLVEQGEINTLTVEPRIRITKEQKPDAATQ